MCGLVWAALLLILLAALPRAATADFYTLTTRFSADPSPLVVGDRLFIYSTHDEDHATSFSMIDYNVFSTIDGVNWRDDGIAFSPVHNTSWAHNAWAQQVIWHAPLNRFLMFFPGMGEPLSVGVASATHARGPFVDYALRAIAPGEDPTVFMDDDGTPVLCTATSQPYNMPWCGVLNPDMKSWRRNQTQLFINGLQPGNFFEAPWLFKYKGVYYLSFMEDFSFGASVGAPFGWSLGYATNNSTDPLTNYTYRGPLMWANNLNCDDANHCLDAEGSVGGNAHHGFALDFPTGSGKHWIVYHTRGLVAEKRMATFSQRNVAIDRLYFDEGAPGGGIVTPVASTPNFVRQLAWVNPYLVQPAASFAAGSALFLGTQPAAACDPAGGMWRYVWNASHGDAVLVRGVDFGGGGSGVFTARVAAGGGACVGCALVARAGGAGGLLFASAPVAPAGGWEVFFNATARVTALPAGVVDLALVFRCPGAAPGACFNLASWGFSGGAPGGGAPPPLRITATLRSGATGRLVMVDPRDAAAPLTASGDPAAPSAWQEFRLVDGENGYWGLQAAASGRWVSAGRAPPGGALTASEPTWGPTAPGTQWRLSGTPDGSYALVAQWGGRATSGPNPGDAMCANGTANNPLAFGGLFWINASVATT